MDLAVTFTEEDMEAGGNQSPLKSKDSDHEGPDSVKNHFSYPGWV